MVFHRVQQCICHGSAPDLHPAKSRPPERDGANRWERFHLAVPQSIAELQNMSTETFTETFKIQIFYDFLTSVARPPYAT